MVNIALGLGGNIGDVPATFSAAIELLKQGGILDIVLSSPYKNPAVNCVPNTPDFINGVITGKWDKTPFELLSLTKKTEVTLGRSEIHRSNTSRSLDIDIILFGDMIISTEKLIIPHPKAKERDFVLVPLNEIASDWIFPDTGKTVNAALKELLGSGTPKTVNIS